MKGADDLLGVFVGEGPEESVHHVAQLAGVDEEHCDRPVAEGSGSLASHLRCNLGHPHHPKITRQNLAA
ncbi:MAG: hypothetical protein IT422_19650 [Pirellulaceae bacterium]|nr:hypothetical protein [Pirellulaceae bacterium]